MSEYDYYPEQEEAPNGSSYDESEQEILGELFGMFGDKNGSIGKLTGNIMKSTTSALYNSKRTVIMELLKSLNMGNTGQIEERVGMAIGQYQELVSRGILEGDLRGEEIDG